MAKDEKAIYAPGELSRVRNKLGVTDVSEAKRMAELLGGEVGTEKSPEFDPAKVKKPFRRGGGGSASDAGGGGGKKRSGKKVDVAAGGDEKENISVKAKVKLSGPYPGDDPSVPAKLGYSERVKIDQYSGQLVFEIKSSMQVLASIFAFFKEPVDYVNQRFVTKRMNEYYAKIERLVNSARNLFPKNNMKRSNQLKRTSPFVFKIIDTLRTWNIEQLAKNIHQLQSHPRGVRVTDFAETLREIYKPLFILEDLDTEAIKTAFKLIYKILYIESPMDAKEKYQNIFRNIIASLVDIRRTVHYGLYPLLMKMISDRFIPYDRFFVERHRRFMAFLGVTEAVQLNSADLAPQQIDSLDVETLQQNMKDAEDEEEVEEAEAVDGENPEEAKEEEDPNDPKVIERKIKEEAKKAESKAMEQGRAALESLFPKASWEKLNEFPDLYPYFANIYSMKHGYELIPPADPIQQVAVLMHILDDFFIGLRDMSFGSITGSDGSLLRVYDEIGEILNNWRSYIEDSFSKDYLPRLGEYCRMLENSPEARTTTYAKKNINELHWIKRLYFLPYYKFESIGPPPFPKTDIIPIYSHVRKVRKCLTAIAVGIEQGMRQGGAQAKAPCNGINNPWVLYNFPVPNPVSKRLDLMLPPDQRINATLVFFSLSAITILDHIINDENSWAYGNRPGPLFRSVKDEGIIPVFGVDGKPDADKIFRDSLKRGDHTGNI